jgi:hypothetical protein
MLNKLSEKFQQWATRGWLVIIFFILNALFMGYIMPLAGGIMAFVANQHVTPLDLMGFYTPDKAYAMIDSYGVDGRSLYLKIELSADIIYPIIYTLFYGLAISWFFRRGFKPDSKMQKMNLMPVGAWFSDLLENAGIVAMVSLHPEQPALLAWLTMIAGLAKWASFALTLLMLIWGIIMAAMNRFKKQE